jgi:hypothetical protein
MRRCSNRSISLLRNLYVPLSKSVPIKSPIFTQCKWGTRQSDLSLRVLRMGASGAGGRDLNRSRLDRVRNSPRL